MKPALIVPAGALAALLAVAAAPREERPPEGAAEKIAAALPERAYAEPAAPRKLLVFSVTRGFRHASIATGKLALAELGRETGAFEAVISDELANFEPGRIDDFDAILFLSTTQNVFKDAGEAGEKRLRKSLMDFIKGGKGFVGIHAATDTFYNWEEYGEMINGYFWGHPWNAKDRVHIFVEPGQEEHPLVAMMEGEPLVFEEEIYQLKDPYDSDAVHMLLRLDPEKSDEVRGIRRTDGDFGVAWARRWGEGRVFYCSLGHNHHIYWHPKVIRHYLAGIQWALGDYEVPIEHP